jgi:glycosyltransferase involved in cell wall biosynthesis
MVLQALELDEQAPLKTICISFPKAGLFPGHYIKESYIYSERCYQTVAKGIESFDFIYTKGFTSWFFIQQKLKGKSLPKIGVKFHGYEMFQPPVNFKMRLQNWLLQSPVKWINQRADLVFSYGGKITTMIANLGVDHTKVVDIPTGIDPSWLRANATAGVYKECKFLFIGRFERRKGIEELQAVIPEVLHQTEARFEFIGPIPHSKRIKHLSRTIDHGVRDPRYYRQTRCIVGSLL